MDIPPNLPKPKENLAANTVYYGVYIPNEAKDCNSLSNVFEDKVEALKVAKKNKKSRFKAFQYFHEAAEFAVNGSEYPNNNTTLSGLFLQKVSETTQTIGEKASPFKGPKPQELVELRKAIEIGNYKFVKDTIWQNPRYLVSSGDTPSILQEGPRYNALHVAAKSGNAELTELILTTVSNVEFVKLLYGDDNQQNAEDRTAVLLDLYLNTPNKGLNESPLHFASKHGAAEVVEILVSYPQCDKTLRNKFQKTAAEIICERIEGDNIPALKRKIQILLQDSYYVPVLRADDKSLPPLIGEPFSPTSPPVLNSNPLSPRLEIHAYAGPMDKKGAQEFRKIWKTPPRSINFSSPMKKPNNDILNVSTLRFKDPDKGLERIGKKLAHICDVSWKEYWQFLESFVDLSSAEGLNLLEKHLSDRYSTFYNSYIEDAKDTVLTANDFDVISPISNLCQVFSACHLNDSSRSDSIERKTDCEPILYIDKACQVFANRISNDIVNVLYTEDNIVRILENEIKQLELLITSYMDDDRFSLVYFQKIHSRLGVLVGQKLYNNIKEEVRVFLSSKIENVLDTITKSVDCFSSDDEGHNLKDKSEHCKPTIYKKQLICLVHFIINVLTQNYELRQSEGDDDCVKEWESAEACSCIYHMRKTKRNSLSRSSSFKNNTKTFAKTEMDGIAKRLSFDDAEGDQNLMKNGINSSSYHNRTDSSSDNEDDEENEEKFYTPPSSPSLLEDETDSENDFEDTELPKHDIFMESDYPTKLDCEVFNALSYAEVTVDKEKYPHVYKWYHSVNLFTKAERQRWTNLKEPNKTKNVSPNLSMNSSFHLDSPKTSTPSKSWLRITGANSPKAVFKSNSIRM